MTPFETIQAASSLRARFKNRHPDPGEMLVRGIDWEQGRADVTNGMHSYLPELREIEITHVKGYHLLDQYLADMTEVPKDALQLAEEIYKRVRLAYDLKQVEESSSWDYCKAATIDWLKEVRRWLPVHRAAWDYQLGCVPPAFQESGIFMCGEAYSGPYHLTFFNPRGERYYCCLLTRRQVLDRPFFDRIPFADDHPMLGIPDEKEVGS